MSRFGFKIDVYHDAVRRDGKILRQMGIPTGPAAHRVHLGELHITSLLDQKFCFPNNEFQIHCISVKSQRCPPISILQTIFPFSVRCKLESLLQTPQLEFHNLHASCLQNLQTLVSVVGDEEMHLVAMPSKSNKSSLCFWCFSVPLGLYETCLKMLNTRSLAMVFDLDQTLVVANTMKSFADKIKAMRDQLLTETDPWCILRISATLRRLSDDRKMLRQYARTDCVEDNGKVLNVEMEEVVTHLGGEYKKIFRPVIRMEERNIVLTRINPENRDTSVLVRLRPAWEVLRSYLNAKERKRFEVYVCTMAERDYALEMWRLLDPEAQLIGSNQILDRVICVKPGSRKSLLNVFKNGVCHPSVAMVIDDRSEVWEDMDQPRVHVVPAFSPYHDPQAEMANKVAVLCIARNVACNVRANFFKEFDEDFLQRTSEVYYEDEVINLPHPQDLINYMISKEVYVVPKSNPNTPISEGMSNVGVHQRLKQWLQNDKFSSEPFTQSTANYVEFGHKISQPPATIISNATGSLIPSQEPGLLGPLQSGQEVKEDNTIQTAHQKIQPSASVKESDVVMSNKNQPQLKPFSHNDGVAQNHASFNGREFQSEAGTLNLLLSHSIRELNEIGRQCSSKVEFRSIDSTSKDFQFSIEVIFGGDKIGIGMGSTKEDAQEQAAKNAIRTLSEIHEAFMGAHDAVDNNEFGKLSTEHENGFLCEKVDPESSAMQTQDQMPQENA